MFILISIIIAIFIAFLQFKYFHENRQKLQNLKGLFLSDSSHYSTKHIDEICQIQSVGDNQDDLNHLIKEINQYVQKSVGSADYIIIQNKTERQVESLYEHATAELSFPTYIGLMGTFAGTLAGLVGFLSGGNDLADESKVTNLIIGVLVSMATSLIGLVLTTLSNHEAASVKKQLDEQKNEFLDFIQLELIPQLQTTITTLQQTMSDFVPKFDHVINNFEKVFTAVIGKFEETFNKCTDNFGKEFKENGDFIAKAVGTLGNTINKITDNVDNQRKLLEELRSEQMFDTLQQFVAAAEAFRESSNSIEEYNELLQKLLTTTQVVINKQDEFAESLSIPRDLVIKVKSLLDRIEAFERNINAVGENISQSEMLGNRELILIQKHLDSLEEKKQLADRFLDTNNEELTTLFQQQSQIVKSLFSNYQHQLEDERDALSSFVRETLQIISKKKVDLLNHLENAFDISKVHTMFSNLKTLPEIVEKLEELKGEIVLADQQNQQTLQLINAIEHLQTSLNLHSSSQKDTLATEREILIKVLTSIGEREHSNQELLAKNIENSIDHVKSDISNVQEEIIDGFERIEGNIEKNNEQTQNVINQVFGKTNDNVKQFANETQDKLSFVQSDIINELGDVKEFVDTKLEGVINNANDETSALKSEISQMSSQILDSQRTSVKKVVDEISVGIGKTNGSIKREAEQTNALIQSVSSQTQKYMKELSDKEQRSVSDLTGVVLSSGKSIHDKIDKLTNKDKKD